MARLTDLRNPTVCGLGLLLPEVFEIFLGTTRFLGAAMSMSFFSKGAFQRGCREGSVSFKFFMQRFSHYGHREQTGKHGSPNTKADGRGSPSARAPGAAVPRKPPSSSRGTGPGTCLALSTARILQAWLGFKAAALAAQRRQTSGKLLALLVPCLM